MMRIRTWIETFLSLIYPPRCPGCGEEVVTRGAWCPRCLAEVWAPRQLALPRTSPLSACLALVHYRGGVKHVLRDMKFRGRKKDVGCLSSLLTRMTAREMVGDVEVVVPVPISTHKRKLRGFNQTEVLFEEWAKDSGYEWHSDILVRVRDTEAQWQLTKRERKANLQDAFGVYRAETVAGKRVLLVDDIYTTGATMEICAALLLKAGAKRVTGLVIASDTSAKK